MSLLGSLGLEPPGKPGKPGRRVQERARRVQERARRVQEGPEAGQEGPEAGQERARIAQRGGSQARETHADHGMLDTACRLPCLSVGCSPCTRATLPRHEAPTPRDAPGPPRASTPPVGLPSLSAGLLPCTQVVVPRCWYPGCTTRHPPPPRVHHSVLPATPSWPDDLPEPPRLASRANPTIVRTVRYRHGCYRHRHPFHCWSLPPS